MRGHLAADCQAVPSGGVDELDRAASGNVHDVQCAAGRVGVVGMSIEKQIGQAVARQVHRLGRKMAGENQAGGIDASCLRFTPQIVAGAELNASHCVGCHLAPGVTSSDLRPGLYPHPPNLSQAKVMEARRTFWVIKHDIKMSAMRAWGKSLSDAQIWEIVAFARKMPARSRETYQQLLKDGSR